MCNEKYERDFKSLTFPLLMAKAVFASHYDPRMGILFRSKDAQAILGAIGLGSVIV